LDSLDWTITAMFSHMGSLLDLSGSANGKLFAG
jgi:hypothetical protein